MKSVGQILYNERKRKKLTIDSVQKAIKIHPRYIKAMEEDDYSVFDGKIHAKGFLKIYSDYLGLTTQEIMALWRREYEAHFEKAQTKKSYKMNPIEVPTIVLTPTLVFVTAMVLLLFMFFGYLFYQYKSYNGNPELNLTHPQNNIVVDNSTLDIVGDTDSDSEVYINNEKIICDEKGSFATSVKLNEGINTLSVLSVSSLDKKTEKILTVIYRPPVVIMPAQVKESTPSEENIESLTNENEEFLEKTISTTE